MRASVAQLRTLRRRDVGDRRAPRAARRGRRRRPLARHADGADHRWAAWRWRRSRCCSRPRPPTTPGRGSSGAARSRSSTWSRRAGRRGSRSRSCSRSRSRSSARTSRPTCGSSSPAPAACSAASMAYRMAHRLIGGGLYGAVAGVCAFLALFSSNKYVRDAALGNSEPLLAAIVLWAFERHLDGRRDHALYLGFLAALLRPEAWPFLGLYGLWLWFSSPRLRLRLVAFAALIPALWFLPEWWGSDDPFRAGARANAPNPGSRGVRRLAGGGAGRALHERHDRPGRARHRDRGRLRGRDVAPIPARRRDAGAHGVRARLVPARGRHDRGGLRGQPALPDRDHRRGLRAGRDGRGAGAPGRGVAGAPLRRRQPRPAGDRRRGPPRAWRWPPRRSSRRPTTPRACRAGSSTRPTSGTTSRG